MPTINISITYPDGQGARILNALAKHYGVEPSAATVRAALSDTIRSHVVAVVRRQEVDSAVRSAESSVQPVDVT